MTEPRKDRPDAWVAMPGADDLPEQVEETIRPISEKIGFVPNVARLLAITPEHFVGWWSYFDELMRGPSGLSKTQREMIAVVISAEGRCPYCTQAHAAALRLRTKDPVFVDQLLSNYRLAELEAPDRAMLDFAVELTQAPDRSSASNLEELRKVGFSDEDILHIVELTAIFNYNVRLATGLGLIPNPEYHTLGRKLEG